jgi:hypothetical protein
MTLQDLGNVGEFVAAIATVATLVYLAIQIRQNTAVVRTSNYSDLTSKIAEFARQIAGDPQLMDIWQRGLQDYRGLSDLEQGRFHMVASQLLITHQLLMQLHSRGLVDTQFYEYQIGSLAELFKAPGVHEWWSTEKRWYSPEFQQFVGHRFDQPAA